MSLNSTDRYTRQLLAFGILSRRLNMLFASDRHINLSLFTGMLWQPRAQCAVVISGAWLESADLGCCICILMETFECCSHYRSYAKAVLAALLCG